MGCRLPVLVMLGALVLLAEGTEPRPKPEDYPVHAKLGEFSIGAELLYRSLFAGKQSYFVPDYLVIEVALFGPKGKKITVSAAEFTLRVNGKRRSLLSQAPSVVAAGLRHPDWGHRRGIEAVAGVGNVGVILGRPEIEPRFPGDSRPARTRLPAPPRVPEAEDRSGLEVEPAQDPAELVLETALPEGARSVPFSGYLYFPYTRKTQSIRSLELLYQGPAGEVRAPLL